VVFLRQAPRLSPIVSQRMSWSGVLIDINEIFHDVAHGCEAQS
jgi:hypothetical protein